MGAAVATPADPYAGLPPAERTWLKERTGVVLNFFRQSTENALRIGHALAEVKARIGHGRFMGWVAACLPFTYSTANRMMLVAEQFGESSHVANFDASAAYLLAQVNTPPAARACALDLAGGGRRVTLELARTLVRTHSVGGPDDDDEDDTPLETGDGLAEAGGSDTGGDDLSARPDPSTARYAAIGKALCELVGGEFGEAAVHIRVGYDEGERVCNGTFYPPAEESESEYKPRPRPRHEHGRDVLDLLETLLGRPRLKTCNGCRKPLRLTLFADDSNQPDGLNPRCKPCERTRMARVKRGKGSADG